MDTSRPVVKQLDHVVALVDEPRRLFDLLTGTLGLPVAWPLASYPAFQSGGVALGNLYLEVMQCGPRRSADGRGRFCAVAFESPGIDEAARELSRRRLPHTPVVSYVEQGADGGKTKIRANAVLGRMLGKDFLLDLTVALSRLPGATRLSDAGSGSALDRWQIAKLFERNVVFLCEFYYENFGVRPFWDEFRDHGEKRAADRERLRERGGGALGVESVKEVVAGVRDFDAARELWRRLYAPAAERAEGVWEIEDGPALRLVRAGTDSVQRLVLKVTSPARAETSLRESGMLGAVTDIDIQIAPGSLEGLDVRLVG
ncbi:MAG TPA: hypothetical protein VGB98_03650 [Pyrinomonadaceae bacterium]|jgi:hypothetical protein